MRHRVPALHAELDLAMRKEHLMRAPFLRAARHDIDRIVEHHLAEAGGPPS